MRISRRYPVCIAWLLTASGAFIAATPGDVAAETPLTDTRQVRVSPQVDTLPEEDAPKVGDPVGDAELYDLSRFAEQRGISVDQAIADYAWRFNFSLLAAQVGELAPDAYTYAQATDARSAEIWFASGIPTEAVALLEIFRSRFPDIEVLVRSNVGLDANE